MPRWALVQADNNLTIRGWNHADWSGPAVTPEAWTDEAGKMKGPLPADGRQLSAICIP
jgi:hypothetical protein